MVGKTHKAKLKTKGAKKLGKGKGKGEGGEGKLPPAISRARKLLAGWEPPMDGEGFPNANKLFDFNSTPEAIEKSEIGDRMITAKRFIDHVNATVFAKILGYPFRPKVAKLMVLAFSDSILRVVGKGGRMQIPNLVVVEKKFRKARKARNPATGETIKVPAKTVMKARVPKPAKDYVLSK